MAGLNDTQIPALVGDVLPSFDADYQLTTRDRRDRRPEPDGARQDVPAEPTGAQLRLLAALIPPRFRDASLEGYQATTDSQRTALAAARKFIAKALAGSPVMLALIGKQGTGKSHLLYAVARRLLSPETKVYARPWYRLADELRYGGKSAFNAGASMEAWQVRDQWWSQRIVLLDEVRPTASTPFDDTELAKFACHAYDANLVVLITTNVSPLADVMGPGAASRFTQIVIDGPDRRQE